MPTNNSYKAPIACVHKHSVANSTPAAPVEYGAINQTCKLADKWAQRHPNPYAPRRSGNKPPWNKGK